MIMAEDVRRTGPVGLPGVNRQQSQDGTLSLEDQWKLINSIPRSSYSSAPEESVGLALMDAGYGKSQYDEGLTSTSQLGDLGDIRYENQPWYDTLANGLGKMLGTAGTTFVSSLVGLPYGLFEVGKSFTEGRENPWSALWDNDVTQGLADVDKWLEENMTNYKSQAQQNAPWYSFENLLSMNFIADDVIKNMGFTLGAAASMAVGSGSLGLLSKAFGAVNDVSKTAKMGQAALSALFSATGEGMIEARQGVEERNKLELQRFNDAMAPEKAALDMELQEIQSTPMDYQTYKQRMSDWQAKNEAFNQKMEAGKQQIEESSKRMGNKILLANQGLLTLGNLIQFGKAMTKSYNAARHAAETSSKFAKPFGMSAQVKNAAKLASAENPYEIIGNKTLARIGVGSKGLITEGSEEMNQEFIRQASDYAYKEQDVNDYWKAKLDPESYREATKGLYTMGQILDSGFKKSWGDLDQWEQFVIGGITGLAGSYAPTKLFNQDKSKSRWNPMRYGEWSGGAYNEIQDWNKQYDQFEENIDDLNKVLAQQDFPSRIRSMVGHTYTESQKNTAAEEGDKKAWKDADDKQTIHDIQAFVRAGKVDDLRAIYQEMGKEMDAEDVENILKSTTKEITAEEDKQNHDRMMDEQIAAKQQEISALYNDVESLQSGLLGSTDDSYDANRNYVIRESQAIFDKIAKKEEEVNALTQEKDAYVGQKYFVGSYVDKNGNRTATDDEIKGTVTHNADELNRKLNSYLESITAVNEMSNGNLTKDQEDNLAYLHNMSKESIHRMNKTMGKVRSQLPDTFLMKTDKTPEQLAKQYASSDLTFTKNDNTKEGYVEVHTNLMNDANFAHFFQKEIMRGGNINPEFAESADEKALREKEEWSLSPEEKKKKARERTTKKWVDALKKQAEDADEQWDTNWELLVDNFMKNYRQNNNASMAETAQAFGALRQDLQDASDLFDQAGEFYRTFNEYMQHPELIDEAKEKEETKATTQEAEQQLKNKFAGKSAKEINQEVASGDINIEDLDEFLAIDPVDLTDDEVKQAHDTAKESSAIRQKAASLKGHIQDQIGDNPTPEQLAMMDDLFERIDNAVYNADSAADINIDNAYLNTADWNPSEEQAPELVEEYEKQAADLVANAFNFMQEDENVKADIPDTANPTADDTTPEPTETGDDAVPQVPGVVVTPDVQPEEEEVVIAENPLTESALSSIMTAVRNTYEKPTGNGVWRSTTTRHIYGKSTGTYHDSMAKTQYGENSVRYKRSKAIWEYFNSNGIFDRQENASKDRIKEGQTIHFMVKYFPEIYGKEYSELTEEEKPNALVLLMLCENNDTLEVVGDLPLVQFEPSYKGGDTSKQGPEMKLLVSLQEKAFKAFDTYRQKESSNEAVVDTMQKEGAGNLNLTFDNKAPMVSKVKQVMNGVIPFRTSEKHTLNEVMGSAPLQLGVRVTGNTIAIKRKDKNAHGDIIVPAIGSMGQPYMLIPTAAGNKMAVPFYMPSYNAKYHKNTEFYKTLTRSLYFLLDSLSMPEAQKEEVFHANMDVLKALLQVDLQKGVGAISATKEKVTLHLRSLTDENVKYDIEIANPGDKAQASLNLADALSGIPINVSLMFLNDNISTGPADNRRTVSYNKLIGEIADVNLPRDTTHTVNSWFTVQLTSNAGQRVSPPVRYKTVGTQTAVVDGRTIEVNVDSLTAVDPATGEVITEGEEVALLLARIKANKPQNAEKTRVMIDFGGETLTYDRATDKFVKSPTVSPTPSKAVVEGPTAENPIPAIEIPVAQPEVVQPETTEEKEEPKPTKTIEQVEQEMQDKKVINRQTVDAWNAIPEALKLKLVNDGATIQLTYNGRSVSISMSNLKVLKDELKKANMAAKGGKLEVTEGVQAMEKSGPVIARERENKARRWLAKNLPSLSSEERTQFVEKLARGGENASKMWGSYRNGVIEILNNAPMGTVYHEAFHYVVDMILSKSEQETLLDIAKEAYGVSDNWTAGERLAEDFRRYALDENAQGIVGKIKRWIRRLKDKIMRYNRISDATVNQLFWKINNGELAQKAQNVESFEETQQRVLREIRNVQQEKFAWRNLSRETKDALKDSGITESIYSQMSLEEKEQYVKCRG